MTFKLRFMILSYPKCDVARNKRLYSYWKVYGENECKPSNSPPTVALHTGFQCTWQENYEENCALWMLHFVFILILREISHPKIHKLLKIFGSILLKSSLLNMWLTCTKGKKSWEEKPQKCGMFLFDVMQNGASVEFWSAFRFDAIVNSLCTIEGGIFTTLYIDVILYHFVFCKAVSFCIIIYKLNYSSVSNKMFCSPQSLVSWLKLKGTAIPRSFSASSSVSTLVLF